jgi:hypothetical protein
MNVQFFAYDPNAKLDGEGCMVCQRLDDLTSIVTFEEENELACGTGECFAVTKFHALCSEHHQNLWKSLVKNAG